MSQEKNKKRTIRFLKAENRKEMAYTMAYTMAYKMASMALIAYSNMSHDYRCAVALPKQFTPLSATKQESTLTFTTSVFQKKWADIHCNLFYLQFQYIVAYLNNQIT